MAADDDRVILLEGDDGRAYTARILGITVLEGRRYAALTRMDEPPDEEAAPEAPVVIMRLTERKGLAIFQAIEDDEEYERVVAHVVELVVEHRE